MSDAPYQKIPDISRAKNIPLNTTIFFKWVM